MGIKEILYLVIYLSIALTGTTLIKQGGSQTGSVLFSIFGMSITPRLILGIMFYGCSFMMYMFMISKSKISLVVPVANALSSAAVVVIGVLIFKEKLGLGQAIGILLILSGILVTGLFTQNA